MRYRRKKVKNLKNLKYFMENRGKGHDKMYQSKNVSREKILKLNVLAACKISSNLNEPFLKSL